MAERAEYARRVSFNERLYLAEEQIKPGFCIQIVVEGAADDEARFLVELERAVALAAEANPGSRLVLDGALGWMRWVARGPIPAVRVVRGGSASALPPDVDRPLSPVDGPTCEVVFVPSVGLVFRCFHGIMDARGLLHFAEDVFRALRGEPLTGSNSTLNDTQFVQSMVGNRKRPFLKSDRRTITGAVPSRTSPVIWKRVSLHGPTPGLVAKIASFLSRHAAQFHTSPTRIMIPVDVRNYQKELQSTANLSYPIFIDVSPEQDWRDVQKIVLKKLSTKEPMRLDPAERVLPWLPMWLVRRIYAAWIGSHRRTGRFPFSALVTHVGLQGTSGVSGGGFEASSLYFLPVQTDFVPLTVSAVSNAKSAELVVSAPSVLLDEARLSELCDAIRTGLGAA